MDEQSKPKSISDSLKSTEKNNEDKDNIESFILFFVDKNGEMGYNADWSEGIRGFADMFFSLSYGSLLDDVLNDIEQECVRLGKSEELQEILLVLTQRLKERNLAVSDVGDSVVVSPLSDLHYQ
jgi:hypothetical protein